MSSTLALNNATVISSGTFLYECGSDHEFILFWNIQGPITGTSPTIQFTLQEIDPSDQVTPIGQTVNSTIINTTGTGQVMLSLGISTFISVIWTVSGTNPSFGNTSVAIISRQGGNTVSVTNTSSETFNVITTRPVNSATSSVAGSTSDVMLLAENTNRLGATVFNDSTSTLYIKLGASTTTTDYTVQVLSKGYYEVPYGYGGTIHGIWLVANGNARITELT